MPNDATPSSTSLGSELNLFGPSGQVAAFDAFIFHFHGSFDDAAVNVRI